MRAVFARYRCRIDTDLSLVDDISEVGSLLGFSTSKIHEQYNNSLIRLIHPDQREDICDTLDVQIRSGADIEVVMPVCDDSGKILWIMNRGRKLVCDDGEYLEGVLTDITSTKNQYDNICKRLELYRIVISQTSSVVFEWDILGDTISFSDAWCDIFGYVPKTRKFSEAIASGGHVNQEDVKRLYRQLQVMHDGSSFQILEIRIAKQCGQWVWCKIRATGIFDNTGKLIRIVGVIIDIDDEKKAKQSLMQQAEQDSLTKLLNANTTRKLAEKYLEESGDGVHCALLVIDLDDFKSINDKFGHLIGDEALLLVSDTIKRLFRQEDIVGRVGGDEFVVLMKNVSNAAKVKERCQQLIRSVQNILISNNTACDLSCSIGAIIVSGSAARYGELFSSADQALYRAKDAGKNQLAFYE